MYACGSDWLMVYWLVRDFAVFEPFVECDHAAPGEGAGDTLESHAIANSMIGDMCRHFTFFL